MENLANATIKNVAMKKIFKNTVPFWAALFLSLFSVPCLAQQQWQILDNMPTVAGAIDPAVFDGKVYVFGGKLDEINSSDNVWVFDPEAGWTFGGKLPDSLEAIVTEEWNGEIYLFGGHSHPDFIFRKEVMTYDPATQVFDTVGQMPTAKAWFTSVVFNGKIYLMGGNDDFGETKTVDIFDPANGSWAVGAPLSTARGGPSADTLGGRIYVTGGGAGVNSFNTVEIYDPTTGWQYSPALLTQSRAFHACKTVNGKLFVMGGAVNFSETFINDVEYFDPSLGEWVEFDALNYARRELGAAVLGGDLYVFGGGIGPFGNATFLDKVERYQVVNASHEAGLFFDHKLRSFPNPFSSQTTIAYHLDQTADVELSIYDLYGRPVRTLINERQMPGEHTVVFIGNDLPKGVYLCRLQLNGVGNSWVKTVMQ